MYFKTFVTAHPGVENILDTFMIDVIVTKDYEKAKMYYENQLAYKTTIFASRFLCFSAG